MAFELNVVAAGNVAVLRAIDAGGWSTRAELAQSVGKDPRNLPRDIGVLAKAGLIADAGGTALTLTEDGRAQLEAIARAEGQTSGGDLLPDERLVVHAQLRPDPDNPRKDFVSEDAEDSLDELRQSILLRGRLLQNLVVRADPEGLADYIVTTGNRRWHAIQQAIWDGDWPEDRPIRVVVREGTAQEHLLTAVTENMIRRSMSAIEEAEAFGDLLNIHGMKTIDISHETGLSQKVIQNRLKLLRLSDDDKERMRLPEAHPGHLGYKAALRQLTVTREGPTDGELQDFVMVVHGALHATYGVGLTDDLRLAVRRDGADGRSVDDVVAWIAETKDLRPLPAREPGSSDPSPTPAETPSLGKKLTDTEALILAEIVDKAEREPNDQHPDYTAALPAAMKSGVPHLIARGLLGTRQLGMTLLIRPLLHTSGLKEWLEDIGFNRDRKGVLSELAIRVQGADNVINREQCGIRYATAWLNLEGDPRNEVATPGVASERLAAPEDHPRSAFPTGAPSAAQPYDASQPELIEATEEEKPERQRIEDERACAARAQAAAERLAGLATDWMGFARARGARDYLNPCFEGGGVISNEAMALELISAIVDGRTGEAAALLATLNVRAGVMGAQQTLKSMSLFKVQNAVSEARTTEAAA